MIRALDLLSFILFLLGCLLLGVFGTWQEAAPFWPGAACLWVSALMGVFTVHWRQRAASRSCLVLLVLFTAYILWRGLNSSVAYLARQDMVFCATAFIGWVQTAARMDSIRRRYALMAVWALLIWANLGFGLYQQFVNPQANPLSFLGYTRDPADAVFSGFFPNSNHLCGFMELTGFVFLAVAVCGRVQLFTRVLCAGVFAAAAANVALSTSRGGLAFGIGVLIFAGLLWALRLLQRGRRHGSGRTGLKFAVAALACVVAGWVAWTQLEGKFGHGKIFMNLNGRAEVWGRAYEQWQESPFIGTGARSFEYYERSYRNMNTSWITWHPLDVDALFAHNDWLQLLADYGLAGLLLGIAVLGVHCWKALLRLISSATEAEPGQQFSDPGAVLLMGALCGMIPFAIHCAADFQMHIGVNAVTAAMVLGLMASPGSRRGQEENGPRAWRAGALLMAAAAAGVLAWKVVPWAIGDYHTNRSAGIPDSAQEPERVELEALFNGQQIMLKAVEADPQNPAAWCLLGRTEGAIANAFASASPGRPSPLVPGYQRSALGRFKKAAALYPQNPYYLMYVAATLDYTGKAQEAEDWWKRALQWGDGARNVHHFYGDHCMGLHRYAEAYEHYVWAKHGYDGAKRALVEQKEHLALEKMQKQAAPPAPEKQPDPGNTPPAPK